jgi:hypothetical protein
MKTKRRKPDYVQAAITTWRWICMIGIALAAWLGVRALWLLISYDLMICGVLALIGCAAIAMELWRMHKSTPMWYVLAMMPFGGRE